MPEIILKNDTYVERFDLSVFTINGHSYWGSGVPDNSTYFSVNGSQLQSIEYSNGYLSFDIDSSRPEADRIRTTGVTVLDQTHSTVIRKISFGQSYFGDLRLKLDSVSIYNGSAMKEVYKFQYNPLLFPPLP